MDKCVGGVGHGFETLLYELARMENHAQLVRHFSQQIATLPPAGSEFPSRLQLQGPSITLQWAHGCRTRRGHLDLLPAWIEKRSARDGKRAPDVRHAQGRVYRAEPLDRQQLVGIELNLHFLKR